MTIEPVAGTPGLWQAPGWSQGMPGLYAVVAGASAYPWLRGGSNWDHQHPDYGLEQLVASAATAAALFEWLRDVYTVEGRPLVWAALMLSPSAAEAATLAGRGLTHYASADYESMRDLIRLWTSSMPRQRPAVELTRSLFFFSGHGLQKSWDPMILPSDYLSRAKGEADPMACISVDELETWLRRNPVAEHLLLVDACRNEAAALYELPGTAHSFLPRMPPRLGSPRVVGVYLATAPNAVAYQRPTNPTTVFGQAVLDGLKHSARPAVGEFVVDFSDLVKFVQPAVKQALSPPLLDPPLPEPALRPYAEPLILTTMPIPAAALSRQRFRPRRSIRELDVPRDLAADRDSLAVLGLRALALPSRRTNLPTRRGRLSAFDRPEDAHNLIQSERLTEFWLEDRFRLIDLESRLSLPKDNVPIQISRHRETGEVWLEIVLPARPGPVAAVFDAPDRVARGRLALPLPCDPYSPLPIDIGLRFRHEDGRPDTLIGATARLGDPTRIEGLTEKSAKAYGYLWEVNRLARFGSLDDVADRASQETLRRVLFDKVKHPTAAMSATLLLARSGHLGHRPDWVWNLRRLFPQFADGSVLAAELLRVEGPTPQSPQVLTDMLELMEEMCSRGAPLFAGAVDYAWSLLGMLRGQAELLPQAARTRLRAVEKHLGRLRDISMPAGQFIALAALPRPTWAPGPDGLSVEEMLRFHRPTSREKLRPGLPRRR